jgi:DNA-binding CsgD family transcriptional regulator
MNNALQPGDHWRQASLIVGREREQSLLRDRFRDALGGRGSLVLIGGEAGIGKTTLVEGLGREATQRGALVLTGYNHDLIANPPYGPWGEILRACPPIDDPRLTSAPRLWDEDELKSVKSMASLFADVWEFFATVASERALLLVLEDLHWSDQDTLDLLVYFARQVQHVRVLLIGTYRDDELTRRHVLFRYLPVLVREARAHRLNVRRLERGAIGELVSSRYGLQVADGERLASYVFAFAEGNPLFAGELLRSLESDGILRLAGDRWMLGVIPQLRVPPLVRQVIEGRLMRLSDDARALLDIAAVIGQEVPVDLLGRVAGIDESTMISGIDEAFEGHVLTELAANGVLQFSHTLVRETLYESVSPIRRRMWHRRIAEALAGTVRPTPDAIAHHFHLAGDARAYEWLLQAGVRAERAYAFRVAAEQFTMAMEFLGEDDPDVRRKGWLLYRIGSLLNFYDLDRSLACQDEASRIATRVDDRILAAYALASHGKILSVAGDARQGLVDLQAGVAAVDRLVSTDVVPHDPASLDALFIPDELPDVNPFKGELVRALAINGRFSEAMPIGEAYVADLDDAPLDDEMRASLSAAWYGLATAYAALGRPADAREAVARASAGFRAVADYAWLNNSFSLDLWIVQWYRTDDLAERRRLDGEASDAWRRAAGALSSDSAVTVGDLWLQLIDGHWSDAAAQAQAGLAGHAHSTWRQDAANALSLLSCWRGNTQRARELIHDILPAGPVSMPGEHHYIHTVRMLRIGAVVELESGDLEAARAWLEAHDRWLAWSGAVLGQSDGHRLWARWYQVAGEKDAAQRHAEAALAAAGEPRQPLSLIAVHRMLGSFATEDGRHDEAERHLNASIDLATACAAPFERAASLLALAELRAATSRSDEARALLDEARAVCEPLGAAPALAQADRIAARLAAPVRGPAYPAGLSAREVDVLRLVAQGLTDAEVAQRLFISPRTVTTHLSSIYNKLGVSSRTAATRFAFEQGIA